jgi:predicted Zn-dependent protease with MMP-like domain
LDDYIFGLHQGEAGSKRKRTSAGPSSVKAKRMKLAEYSDSEDEEGSDEMNSD